jgi:hypothetical protein
MKLIVIILLALIIISLGAGMISLIKDGGKTDRTVKFLTIRIILSVALFVLLGMAFFFGWIQPHGIVPPQS